MASPQSRSKSSPSLWTKLNSVMEENFALSPDSDTEETWELDEEQPILMKHSHGTDSFHLPSWESPRQTYGIQYRLQSRVRRARFSRMIRWSCYMLLGIMYVLTS